jgi:hypothetical protein
MQMFGEKSMEGQLVCCNYSVVEQERLKMLMQPTELEEVQRVAVPKGVYVISHL